MREAISQACLARQSQLPAVLAALESGAFGGNLQHPATPALFEIHGTPRFESARRRFFAATQTNPRVEAKVAAALAGSHIPHTVTNFQTTVPPLATGSSARCNVGPDLFDIRKQSRKLIAFHIVSPDAEIAPAFTAYTAETKSGRTLAASSSPKRRQHHAPATWRGDETVLRGDLKTLAGSAGSLMPTGLDAAMTPEDLCDLLAFFEGEQ